MHPERFDSQAEIDGAVIRLTGPINRHIWLRLMKKVLQLIETLETSNRIPQKLIFDLSKIEVVDSSALVFFFAIQRHLQSNLSTRHCTIQLNDIPTAMRQLGSLYHICS